MKTQKIMILLTSLFLISDLFAMNLNLFRKKSYERISGKEEDPHINRLLSLQNLNDNQKADLANRCLQDPDACCDRNIFQKIPVNYIFPNGSNFVHRLFGLSIAPQGSGVNPWLKIASKKLLCEALDNNLLNLHIKLNANNPEDLALDILKNGEEDLIIKILNHVSFSPNTNYGVERYPLATMLILAQKYDVFLLPVNHPHFDHKNYDAKNHGPGYYLLEQYKGSENLKYFMAFMGSNYESWNLYNLGLGDLKHFDLLFQNILQNDQDRLVVFEQLVRQLCLWHENINYTNDNKINKVIENNFFSGEEGYKVYLNKYFTQNALKILNEYGVLNIITNNDSRRDDFWSQEAQRDINKYNLNDISSACAKHFADDSKKCSTCNEENADLIKSGLWCDHASCLKCWTNYCFAHESEKEMFCPVLACNILLAPSLFIALHACESDQLKIGAIQNSYEQNLKLQRKKAQNTLRSVCGLAQCVSCSKNLVLDVYCEKTRKLSCSCTKQYIVHGQTAGGLLPLGLFEKLGECNECGTLVEKIGEANNSRINCPVCKKDTIWVEMKK